MRIKMNGKNNEQKCFLNIGDLEKFVGNCSNESLFFLLGMIVGESSKRSEAHWKAFSEKLKNIIK